MKSVSVASLIIVLSSSCAVNNQGKTLSRQSKIAQKLNGVYKNKSTTNNLYLWSILNNRENLIIDTCAACYVRIDVIDKHTASISLLSGDKPLKTILYKGRIKQNESTLVKRTTRINPEYVILWTWVYYKCQLGIDNQNNLSFNTSNWGYTAFVFLPLFIAENESGGYFERVNAL
ncbi:hypothetical protein BDD43_1741 [Mucilaginibacter gracilis]|uniref:Lipoprotein n=1 Tax=Mucilaginibacter gracilis TaxID=423350 RepID=A0A495IYF0_9SPHI|nr:hypothetical protein [Mucilaginibacter gracilis]RKR81592.1 hypothetical protein BDD43_1741 [Mucilaginibacter gracilis]